MHCTHPGRRRQPHRIAPPSPGADGAARNRGGERLGDGASAMEGLAELSLHGIDYSSARWEHAECCQRAGIDDGLAVDQHLEFSVTSLDHFDVGSQFATKTRRHPDGVQAGHSIGAIADGNPSHATSSDRVNQSRPRA
jgi:hypothetical protein